jgi:hypothetical protein
MPETVNEIRHCHVSRAKLVFSSSKIKKDHSYFSLLSQSQDDLADWLLTENVSSWTGSPADKGWQYLRQSLERHDSVETDHRYAKVCLETIMSYEKASLMPSWLVRLLEVISFFGLSVHRLTLLLRKLIRTISFERSFDSKITTLLWNRLYLLCERFGSWFR